GQASFMESFTDVIDKVLTDPPVLAHRDFNTENLIFLPERRGLCRVGLLDFQDAVLAHPAFDLVLLLQDARHRPPESVESVMLKRYIEATGQDDLAFRASYAVLTVQRNLRVLGLFARLSRSAGKERFAGLMPTLWENLERGLDHPALRPVAGLVRDLIPEPTADVIQFLRNS
ncbi:MAG: phosphotransferase, partial [Pseudomonadota bacterium]